MLISHQLNLWIIAGIFIFGVLFLGLYIEHIKLHKIHFKEACIISIGWILAAFIFNIILWCYLNAKFNQTLATQKSLEFFTGYLIEKSLSLDNVFVFALIFKYFKIPKDYQRIVLNYGIISAVVLRLIMILAGVWVINKFHWILYFFGALLIISGSKILIQNYLKQDIDNDLNNNLVLKLSNKFLRTTHKIYQDKFIIKKHGKTYVTPLFLAMVLIEITDVVFATDSIPVIFGITHDPFIIITSNVFAIMGLRSLYFLLSAGLSKFLFLTQGLAVILIFVGIKMLFGLHLSIITTLSVIFIIITICILLSILK